MDIDLKNKLRSAIESELEELRASETSLCEARGPVEPDRAIGRLTRMDAIQDQSMKEAQLVKLRQRKDRLVRALDRIESPGYGMCLKCKQPIPVERLMIVPEAVNCVRCAA